MLSLSRLSTEMSEQQRRWESTFRIVTRTVQRYAQVHSEDVVFQLVTNRKSITQYRSLITQLVR